MNSKQMKILGEEAWKKADKIVSAFVVAVVVVVKVLLAIVIINE
jgi:hypothetical protein